MITDKLKQIITQKSSKTFWILFCITLIGLGLRLINLREQSYWADEVLSLDISTQFQHIPQILNYLGMVEVHPPLYYIMLHFWTGWFGLGTFAVRALSVIFGIGCILTAYFWTKILFGSRKAALISAFIIAVLPFQLEFSQEARPYIMYCFFGGLAALWLWQYYRQRRMIFWLGYILANLAGLYLHYSYLYIVVALGGWGLIEIYLNKSGENRVRQFIIWLCAHAVILLGFSFWLTPFFYKIVIGSEPIFGLVRSIYNLRDSNLLGSTLNQMVWLTTSSNIPQVQVFVVFLSQVLLAGSFVRAVLRTYVKNIYSSRRAVFYSLWLIAIPLIFFLFTPQSLPYTVIFYRHLIFILIPIAGLVSWGISLLPKKQAIVILIIFFASLIPFDTDILSNDAHWDKNYDLETIADLINNNYEPGDIVLVSVAPVRTDLTHYLKEEVPVYSFLPVEYYFNKYDIYASRHTMGLIENEYQSRLEVPPDYATINKLDNLVKLYHPKRIWLYAFGQKDLTMHYWFISHNWRLVYWSFPNTFEAALYTSK